MKTILLILTIFALTLIKPVGIYAISDNSSAVDSVLLPKQTYKSVTIITPCSEIYDDGTFKKSFAGYNLLDTDNNLLIKIDPVLEIPVTLKLKEGTYLIRLNNQNQTRFYITITGEQFHHFKIPE